MTDAVPAGGGSDGGAPEEPAGATGDAGLADGEWHRLHPATPLLRGGLALLAIGGILISNFRERLVELFLPAGACPPGAPGCEVDPITAIIDSPYFLAALGAALGIVLLLSLGYWASWRFHTFRVTGEVVEVRSGVLWRTHRQARLDRIQGVTINRPFFARLFGAARLDVVGAGQDANVQLSYLGNAAADRLRADLLRLASGSRAAARAADPAHAGSVIDRRVAELLAPELDPDLAPPESVVRVPPGRLIASTALSMATVFLLVAVVLVVVIGSIAATVDRDLLWTLFTLVPIAFGFGSYLVNRILKFLRYSIAGTPDGVRVGYGLLSTRNETVPPGRIHSVAVSQSLMWRPFGWWTLRVNRASRSSGSDGQEAQQSTTVLPVGTVDDVERVLALLLPEWRATEGDDGFRAALESGLAGRDGDGGFTTSPRRAVVVRWFSRRRNGVALRTGAVLMRSGAVWREFVVVPTPRMQSVSVEQGPLGRALRLATLHVHTVAGPISARIGAIADEDAVLLFDDTAHAGVAAAAADRSHRWRAGES